MSDTLQPEPTQPELTWAELVTCRAAIRHMLHCNQWHQEYFTVEFDAEQVARAKIADEKLLQMIRQFGKKH